MYLIISLVSLTQKPRELNFKVDLKRDFLYKGIEEGKDVKQNIGSLKLVHIHSIQ